ncbi:hypothetical protein [Anaeromyxobacter diazotrophicus]|uniref:Uncharacterized protein n=1 Tax=Anaeromyxobacter diazotrophicus TaxID=2590199 RepID=A0A7I9VQP7_9BACT|nr:hypothetical protein [Anaeromyxobacter diazotrophicus]GEJ58725.1 hypothetical protein AMYX_34660 [Anaeromyxobacter diazotrophicus]
MLTPADDQITSLLLRRVIRYQTTGFGLMILLLFADDLACLWRGQPVPRWELVELAAACAVGALSFAMTRRLTPRIQLLEGLVCICMHCKRVRSDGDWVQVERYVAARSPTQFSHGLCPECYARKYEREDPRQAAPPGGHRAA